jgi:8-oxo-dGTP pyrophosphatase MutT (NUDIX family)
MTSLNRLTATGGEEEDFIRNSNYWGKRCAGCLLMARTSLRFLLPFRSAAVDDPHCWGTWGGAIDSGDGPGQSIRRELREESGYSETSSLYPLMVYKDPLKGMVYHNYLAIVPDEFMPVLNWETSAATWTEFGNWPSPLHPGLEALLRDPVSVKSILYHMNRC